MSSRTYSKYPRKRGKSYRHHQRTRDSLWCLLHCRHKNGHVLRWTVMPPSFPVALTVKARRQTIFSPISLIAEASQQTTNPSSCFTVEASHRTNPPSVSLPVEVNHHTTLSLVSLTVEASQQTTLSLVSLWRKVTRQPYPLFH